MDFDHFISLCGRSLFAEEYRGNLDAAWDYLQQNRPDADPVVPNVQAEYLRCTSIYSILIGRFSDAYKSLEALHGLLDHLPQEWGLRYTNYKVLADYTRRYPPATHFYHENGNPLEIVMLSDVIGAIEISSRFMRDVQKYLHLGLPRDQGFCQVLSAVQCFPKYSRDLSSHFHPLSCRSSYGTPKADPVLMIKQYGRSLQKFRDIADANMVTGMATYLNLLILKLHLSCQNSSTAALEDHFKRCSRLNDHAGMGNCKMIEGDNYVSPAFTSPLSLNLIITNVSSCIGEDKIWDPIEFGLNFDYSLAAQVCYEDALNLFRTAGCKRGQAAVLLRQACCLHNEARHQRASKSQFFDFDVLGNVETKLREALRLFGKDEANVQIVKAHQLMLQISMKNPRNAKTIARELGEWGVQSKNEILTHFIGLLLSRFARQEWDTFSSMDAALLAWEYAYEILKPVGDEIPLIQSVVCRAWVQHDMFNNAACRMFTEEAISMVDQISSYYDTRIRSSPHEKDREILLISKFNLFWSLGRTIGSIWLRMEELQAFETWQTKLAYWIENDESFQSWRERMQNKESIKNKYLTFTQEKLRSLWHKAMADDAARVVYGSANMKCQKLLEDGDVVKAEEVLRSFVKSSQSLEGSYSRELYRILACERIGDLAKAREILDSIDDNILFHENLDEFKAGNNLSIFPEIAENALTFLTYGGDLERARRILDLIIQISPAFFEENSSAIDLACRIGSYGAIMKDVKPKICFNKLLEARKIIETVRVQTQDLDAKIGTAKSSWVGEVYLDLARICLSNFLCRTHYEWTTKAEHGHFENISWVEHALLFVEMSRARAVLESLQKQSKKSGPLSEAVHKRRLLRSLLSLKSLTPEQENEVSQLQGEIEVLEEDGNLTSATAFIERVNSSVEPRLLYESIDENAVVIEATFGSRGCVSFAVTKDGILHSSTSNFRSVDMRRTVMKAMQIMREMTGYINDEEAKRKEELQDLSRDISSVLLAPFADIIRSKSHVIFSVSDPLTAFPFSILFFDDKPLIMHAAVSQIPSLTVLHYLSQRKPASEAPTVSVLAKSPTQEPSTGTRGAKEVNLHMAGIEAVNIARLFATWPIEASHLSRKDFRQYVEGGSPIMHIGTHGDIDHRNPLLSSISIGDGQEFRVADMSAIRSRVNLLVFAACLSGFGKATTGSDVLGFSHVVLSTGCQAYIGSLWKVSDFGSMVIMTLFYRHLKRNPHLAVADVMRLAQLDLLKLDSDTAETLLDGMLENWGVATKGNPSPTEFVPDAEFLLFTLKMILSQLDWTSPFYWAPFTLVGYGGFRFMHLL
ncbi:uncharacterized protein N7443_003976 [Penicillium atrosanguineum]|uniref:CHAT domain-containing protein n=1 Tax=Penicillium atrosanguineum TaxID=1132637 RepID=A0A9W9U7G9_9EURO|nr:uncharacterized protein N7443_003976 [Penicillium atrosanguineum]KAJ5304316.1 hypothetical protein N7443_003976 [Penicillium atrosanguineum]KAJ5323791.1 hypothetical protein N7476_002391 [Penicillium atrosanguineum]